MFTGCELITAQWTVVFAAGLSAAIPAVANAITPVSSATLFIDGVLVRSSSGPEGAIVPPYIRPCSDACHSPGRCDLGTPQCGRRPSIGQSIVPSVAAKTTNQKP